MASNSSFQSTTVLPDAVLSATAVPSLRVVALAVNVDAVVATSAAAPTNIAQDFTCFLMLFLLDSSGI
jgi:hypothetical protein